MARTIPRTVFQDGFAVGWVFGVCQAFKAALDISLTPRVLSNRGTLVSELARKGVHTPPEALQGDAKAVAELYAAIRAAGLVATDFIIETVKGKKRVEITLETEGDPPAYSFSVGDIFYDPPQVHKMDWNEGLKVLRRCIQISKVEADQITAGTWACKDAIMTRGPDLVCSSAAFARLLRTGIDDSAQATAP